MSKILYNADAETLTVRELVEELMKLPPDAKVYTEGCDCLGNIASVTVESDQTIMLNRSN